MAVATDAPVARVRGRLTGGMAEAALLTLALVALGVVLVPAHWSSIWADPEFTGGMGPLANRLVDGQRLYTDGMHSPMPPLTFVLLRVLGGGDVSWLTGSALNFLFQGLTLVVTWLALRRTFGHRVAFAATVCAIPIFFALPKTVVYDAAVELCVAVAALILATLPRRWPVLLGVVSALAVLTKQSTGAGIVGGVLLALLLGALTEAPRAGRWRSLGRTAALYAASGGVAFAVLVLAFAPWASPAGLIHDVLLTGSEPKGGRTLVLETTREWLVDAARVAFAFGLAFGLFALLDRRFGLRTRLRATGAAGWSPAGRGIDADRAGGRWLSVAAAAGAAVGAASWAVDSAALSEPMLLGPAWLDFEIRKPIYQYVATFLALVALALVVLWQARGRGDESDRRFLRVFALLAVAAFGMSLSAPALRWTYDNNPLIAFGLACLLVSGIWAGGLLDVRRPRLRVALATAFTVLLSFVCWASLGDRMRLYTRADVAWPEVAHLDGAKLRPESHGMRALVARVRDLAGPREAVLLLPEDPNVQEWFERPRPRLTSAMVFVDQYWDRYVDEDFRRLAADPPKVIVIGPRQFWRGFARLFQVDRGAERLIDRVTNELLPRRFTRQAPARIVFPNSGPRNDVLDVWVRRGPA